MPPRSRTGLGSSISPWSRAIAKCWRSLQVETAMGTDLLCVMISKSSNLPLSIAVRPLDYRRSLEAEFICVSGRPPSRGVNNSK